LCGHHGGVKPCPWRRKGGVNEQLRRHTEKTLEVQEIKLELQEVNARSRSKEIEVKEKEVEATLLAEENRIMTVDFSLMVPETRF
jgi:hypothetical protein